MGLFSENIRLTCPRELWGTVPMFPKYVGEQERFPKFLKSIWGTGTAPQVPQKYLGNRNSSPSSSKVLWGTFGELWGTCRPYIGDNMLA